MSEIETINGQRVLLWDREGAPLASSRDASDLVGEAFSTEAKVVVIPVERLSPEFLKLSSGLAGEVLQKFVNYGLKVAILGDITAAVAASGPLRDFVRESNRGRSVWFVDDRADLDARIAALA